jgi:hypothetical protein
MLNLNSKPKAVRFRSVSRQQAASAESGNPNFGTVLASYNCLFMDPQ